MWKKYFLALEKSTNEKKRGKMCPATEMWYTADENGEKKYTFLQDWGYSVWLFHTLEKIFGPREFHT